MDDVSLFGRFVKYKPSKSYALAVHGERMIDGIFLGWHLAPGCIWHGLYLMCPLREMEIVESDPSSRRNLKITAHVVREGDFEWNTAQNGMSFPCRIARDKLPKLASLPHDNALMEIESEDAELAEKLSSGRQGGGTDGIGIIDPAVRQVVRDAVTEGAAEVPVLTDSPRIEEITTSGGPATARPPGGNSSSSSTLT